MNKYAYGECIAWYGVCCSGAERGSRSCLVEIKRSGTDIDIEDGSCLCVGCSQVGENISIAIVIFTKISDVQEEYGHEPSGQAYC